MEKSDAVTIEIAETNRDRKGKTLLLGHRARTAAAGKGVAVFDLIIRICAAAAALASAVSMGTAEETLPFFTQFFQFQASYDDFTTFTFYVVSMSIVTGYLVLSMPFSIVCIIRPHLSGPRLLLIICDTLAGTFATSTAAATAAIVYLAHNGNPSANWLAICNQYTDFCQKASGSVVAGFVAVVLIVFLVVLSALALRKR